MSEDIDKKLKFIQEMTKHGLQHFDAGGPVQNTTSNNGIAQGTHDVANPTGGYNPLGSAYGALGQPMQTGIGGAGQMAQGIGAAFTAQNGYQAQLAPTDYTNYQGTINQGATNSLQGYGNFQGIQGQQQALANTLGQQSQGFGPNVAQNQLNQTTGANVQNQAALMAGQRGASANTGLMARQAAQQGAATQQGATGQAATLRAQQQIAAQQALAQQQGIMGQQNIGEQGAMNQLFGGAASAQNAQNANSISNYGMMQGINSQVAQNNANAVNKTTSGLMGGAASALGMLAEGGEVGKDGFKMKPDHHKIAKIFHPHMYAAGGDIYSGPTTTGYNQVKLPEGQGLDLPSLSKMMPGGGSEEGSGSAMSAMKSGGKVSKNIGSKMKQGGGVPGKPKVQGNSYKNDTVKALLSPGEVVIPNSVMQSQDPIRGAADFVRKVMAKKRGNRG